MNKIKITTDEKFQAQTFFNDDNDGGKFNLSEKELAECSFYKKGHTKVNFLKLQTWRKTFFSGPNTEYSEKYWQNI
jgi:hypothetical protein